jgi:opacity protein-like surface antigen
MRTLLTILLFSVFYGQIVVANTIDSIALKGGYGYFLVDEEKTNGGVAGVNTSDDDGLAVNVSMIFNTPYSNYFKPYADLMWFSLNDRDMVIPGVGIRHDIELDSKSVVPFYSVGVGYNFLDWSQYPIDRLQRQSDDGESIVFTAQTGVDFFITDNLAIDLTLRYDAYNIDTTIVENNRVSTIQDRGSVTALAGIVYKFGPKTTVVKDLDADNDGVSAAADLCPATLQGVPVNEAGCPQYRFDIDLDYEFSGFEIEDLVNQPDFDVIGFLQKNQHYALRITGYTDSQGSAKFNQRLSEQRAAQAKDYLLAQGIDASRIDILGRGEREQLFANDSEEHRLHNRRINLDFYRVDGSVK